MPVLKSAKKKLKQDKKRAVLNLNYKKGYKKAVKSMAKGTSKSVKEDLSGVYSKIDKAAKHGVIHKNKAARLKAKVARMQAKS